MTLALLAIAAMATPTPDQGPVIAPQAMVACSEPLATDVGVAILKEGGNAFDAAVGIGFTLAVTFPEAGNIGGGGFLVGLTQHGTPMALDFREIAPAAAQKNMFVDEAGEIVPGKSLESHYAVGVPGTVDGLVELQKKFGKLTLAEDMAPAIELAKLGFTVSPSLHASLAGSANRLLSKPSTALVFYPEGTALAEGSTLKQPDLAKTLQRISDLGRIGFYEGETARLIAEDMEREGGLITRTDLKSYHCKWREPARFRAGSSEIITMPPPSSAGVTIPEILGLVDLKALQAAGHNSPTYVQMLTEAERVAYADRNHYLGDPDYVKMPISDLLSPNYLASRRKSMPVGRAGESKGVSYGLREHMQTTHYCVVDKAGNVAAVTYTLNDAYGQGSMVPGAGFLLNNEMDDFTSKPGQPNIFGLVQGEANAVQPRKRMLSSMSPTIVRRDGRFWETFGSPGGSTILTTVVQTFLNTELFGMNIRQAVDAGRFHHQWLPDLVSYEGSALTPEDVRSLEGMGYHLRLASLGRVNAIQRLTDGSLAGWSDSRGSGKAAGY